MGGVELVVTLHGRGRACPARRFAWADVCGWLPGGGWPLAQGFAGRRGRRPLRFAREWAAAGACPSSGPAGPPSPKGEGKGCCWRRRKVSRGVGDAAPYGLPGNGRQREPAPHPALRGHLPPRGKARAVVGGSGRPRRGLRGHPFPGRRTVGAGHARPGGLRRPPSMVRSVGRGLDPSAGGCPGDGRWHKAPRGVGDAAPYGLPGNGRLPRLTLPTSPPAYSRCCRRQNRWGRSAHRPHARFRRWIRSRGASGHRRSGPEGTGVCCRRNFSSAG